MVSTAASSTLVETVSINYEDFNESFLTCGTCLCTYDGSEHSPKLLACSHTVCVHCLERIAAAAGGQSFRCPICRESINVPRGGVHALPPSFLVNQLLDLMASRRREVVPKCSLHTNQELLFCETCDTVFCRQCTVGGHSSVGSSYEHTVIPFSIAIKRMSEILLYKANECISKLNEAREAVEGELSRLEDTTNKCLDAVTRAFADAHAEVDLRKQSVIDSLQALAEAKRHVLQSQLQLIQAEQDKVGEECEGLQLEVEVRDISKRIAGLAGRLEGAAALKEPRENAHLRVDLSAPGGESLQKAVSKMLATVGSPATTTTFPPLSSLRIEGPCVAELECHATVTTVDYHGVARTCGGDPVDAIVTDSSGDVVNTIIEDNQDGTYSIRFRPPKVDMYELSVSVVGRAVRGSPAKVEAGELSDAIAIHGGLGSGLGQYFQPVAIAYDPTVDLLYVMDTGNCRVKVLTPHMEVVRHLEAPTMEGRSCTGLALWQSSLILVNWRTLTVTKMSPKGEVTSSFGFSGFSEPTSVAVDSKMSRILVADNAHSCVFVFDRDGNFLFQVGRGGKEDGCLGVISGLAVGPAGEIIVADTRLQLFSPSGQFVRSITTGGGGGFCGIVVDSEGRLVVARTGERGKPPSIEVLTLEGVVVARIKARQPRPRRPAGIALLPDSIAAIVDLPTHAVYLYRYW